MGKYTLKTEIPNSVNESNVLYLINKVGIQSDYLLKLKDLTGFTDDTIASWLNINVKTFRTYKKSKVPLKPDLQEHLILLISLIKHGLDVFHDKQDFDKWLDTPNFQLDMDKPMSYLNTISGIRFIDQRLTGIEYGDNA